ncbi:MAG: hypothetical protein AAGC56_01320 [Pseudomonadota bacterium]
MTRKVAFFAALLAVSSADAAVAQSGERVRDRALGKEEFLNTQGRRFDRADADNSGALDQSEYVAFRLAEFDRADRNDDGSIDRGEIRGLQDPVRPGLSRAAVETQAPKTFQRVAQSGAISKQAFLDFSADAFDRVDRNSDGKLMRGELRGLEKL